MTHETRDEIKKWNVKEKNKKQGIIEEKESYGRKEKHNDGPKGKKKKTTKKVENRERRKMTKDDLWKSIR